MNIIFPPPLTVITRVKLGCLKTPGGLIRSFSTASALRESKAKAPASTGPMMAPAYRLLLRIIAFSVRFSSPTAVGDCEAYPASPE